MQNEIYRTNTLVIQSDKLNGFLISALEEELKDEIGLKSIIQSNSTMVYQGGFANLTFKLAIN